MTPRTKSLLALGATFALGVLIGALLVGALGARRADRVGRMGRPGGLVEHLMERVLQPKDEAQRQALLPILEALEARNREIHEGSRDQLRDAVQELQASLAPLLDEEQAERLQRFARRVPSRPGGPPGGPPRRGTGGRGPDGPR